jgi:NitT/TauT family transport system substrate-binding protein
MRERGSETTTRREFLTRAALATAGLAAAACGATGPAARTTAGPTRSVQFLLDVAPYGKHAMFYVAQQQGYWPDRGLHVSIAHAEGSADNASKVAAGAADFGFADVSAVVLARGKGQGLKEICMLTYKSLVCAFGLDTNPIQRPQDLVGKSIGSSTGDTGLLLLPALARINHFDASQVHVVNIEHLTKPAALAQGRIDGAFDYYTSLPAYQAAAQQSGKRVTHFLYADYGLNTYSNGIIARDATLQKDADLARRFLDGLARATAWTVDHPDQATRILLQAQPALSFQVAREQLQIAIEHLMVPEVLRHGIGPVDAGTMRFTVDTIERYFPVAGQVKATDVYRNDLVPAGVLPQKKG